MDKGNAGLKKTKDKPQFLYKFRHFDEQEYYKTYLEGKLYFASAKDFINDPMDTKIDSDYEQGSYEELRAWFIRNFQSAGRMNYEEAAKEVDKAISELGIDKVKSYIPTNKTTHDVIERDVGICSLSANRINPALWEEYVKSNNGFCIEYNFDLMKKYMIKVCTERIKKGLLPIILNYVHYVVQLPIINPFSKNEDEVVENQLFTKTYKYAYEDEWRIINVDGVGGKLKLPTEVIESVYFGTCCEEESIKESIKFAEQKIGYIKFYQVLHHGENFEFEEIK